MPYLDTYSKRPMTYDCNIADHTSVIYAEVSYLYSSPNIIWVIISRLMKWEKNVARMGERRGLYRVLVGKPETDDLEDPDVDRRIILRWIFSKCVVGAWTESSWLKIGGGGGHF